MNNLNVILKENLDSLLESTYGISPQTLEDIKNIEIVISNRCKFGEFGSYDIIRNRVILYRNSSLEKIQILNIGAAATSIILSLITKEYINPHTLLFLTNAFLIKALTNKEKTFEHEFFHAVLDTEYIHWVRRGNTLLSKMIKEFNDSYLEREKGITSADDFGRVGYLPAIEIRSVLANGMDEIIVRKLMRGKGITGKVGKLLEYVDGIIAILLHDSGKIYLELYPCVQEFLKKYNVNPEDFIFPYDKRISSVRILKKLISIGKNLPPTIKKSKALDLVVEYWKRNIDSNAMKVFTACFLDTVLSFEKKVAYPKYLSFSLIPFYLPAVYNGKAPWLESLEALDGNNIEYSIKYIADSISKGL